MGSNRIGNVSPGGIRNPDSGGNDYSDTDEYADANICADSYGHTRDVA